MPDYPAPPTLTNAQRQKFASLDKAKYRREYGLFMAQGTKCVLDTLRDFSLDCLLCTAEWLSQHASVVEEEPVVVKKSVIAQISTLSTPPEVIAIYKIPKYEMPRLEGRLFLALDCVQDPGNLGTIMRVADWMGVTDILATHDTADVWAPKVVQATMGAISRVKVHYVDLAEVLLKAKCSGIEIYGMALDGTDIYKAKLGSEGVIVMGNEGRGISAEVSEALTKRLLIPPYPAGAQTSESLNVAIATAITLSEFRRNG